MPSMRLKQQARLQKQLSGMRAGFTLSEDRLYVRFGALQFEFLLTDIQDSSEKFCAGCSNKISGDVKHWGKQTFEVEGLPKQETKLPLCYDCAVPQ